MKAPNTFKKTVIAVEGLRFDALAEGPVDGELVLFLHGFPEFADAWLDVMHPIAQTGLYCVAVNQRGYSPEARPEEVKDYAIQYLISDVQGFADALSRQRFHLVGHDWGAFVAWAFAAKHADRLQSLSTLSTPHPDAFFNAIESDEDQKQRSRYVGVFRTPGGVAENLFESADYQRLRSVYQGKLSESAINRALNLGVRIGEINVPTLYIWGSQDLALGATAAMDTARYVSGPYTFERLEGRSHWLLAEVPDEVSALLLKHISCQPHSLE